MRIRDVKIRIRDQHPRSATMIVVKIFLQYMYLENSFGPCVGGASIPWSCASWGRRQWRRLAWPTLILLTLILAWGAVVLQLFTQQLQSINSEHGTWCQVKSARTMISFKNPTGNTEPSCSPPKQDGDGVPGSGGTSPGNRKFLRGPTRTIGIQQPSILKDKLMDSGQTTKGKSISYPFAQ